MFELEAVFSGQLGYLIIIVLENSAGPVAFAGITEPTYVSLQSQISKQFQDLTAESIMGSNGTNMAA